MGDDVSKARLRGIGIHDDRISYANLQARGTGNTNSAYTEAEPVAGTPEAQQTSSAAFVATGTPSQEGSLTIRCQRAGGAGLEEGGFLWKDETATTPAYYGWDGPQLVTGWETLKWTASTVTDYAVRPHVIRLNSGKLLAVGIQSKVNPLQLTIKRYDPASSTWSTSATLTLEDPTEQKGPCLVQLPQGRVLLYVQASSGDQVDSYYSDDDGDTWALYAARVLPAAIAGTPTIRFLRAAYSSNEVCLIVRLERTSPTKESFAQYGSSDLGARFDVITEDWWATASEEAEDLDVVPGRAGGFILAYAQIHPNHSNYVRRIASAFDRFSDASLSSALGTPGSGLTHYPITAWRDEDGTIYLLADDAMGTGTPQTALAWRSLDDGATWEQFEDSTALTLNNAAPTANRIYNYSATSVGGRVALLARWVAASADEDPQSLGVIWLGGSSTHTAPAARDSWSFTDTDYVSFGTVPTTNLEGGIWLPVEEPNNVAWSVAGGGTPSLDSPGVLTLTTAPSTLNYLRDHSGTRAGIFAEFALEIDDGDGDTGTSEIAAQLIYSDTSAYEYSVSVRFSSAGFKVYDDNAAADIGAESAVDFTTFKHVRIALDEGRVKTWWATSEQARYWTEGPGGTVSNAGAFPNPNRIKWGHLASGSNVSRWKMAGYCLWPGTWGPASSKFAGSWTSPDDVHPRSFSADPALVHDGVSLSMTDGPAVVGETWKIEQDALYPAANMHPEINPSPAAGWRSTGVTEAKFVWDRGGLTLDSFEGSSVFLMLHRINFELAILESSTNGASWTVRGKVRARDGFDALRFTRTGEIIQPEKGGASYDAGRYVVHGDFVGGTLYDITNTKYRRIAENTSGLWSDRTGAIPRARIEGADDTEATAGTAELWMPSACVVVHEVAVTDRYWRLRIPTATTADGYFEIGQLALGYVDVFGQQHGRGWTYEDRLIVDTQDLLNGSTRAVRRGDRVRRIELSWPDGSDTSQLHESTIEPDYVTGTTSGLPVASYADVLLDLAGMADRKAGASVVWFGSIPRAAGDNAINDPRQWLWCRVTSTTVGRSNVLGDEVETELNRGDAIRLTEIT